MCAVRVRTAHVDEVMHAVLVTISVHSMVVSWGTCNVVVCQKCRFRASSSDIDADVSAVVKGDNGNFTIYYLGTSPENCTKFDDISIAQTRLQTTCKVQHGRLCGAS